MNVLLEDFKFISAYHLPWEKLKNKTIFISGAAGFISFYLIEFLLYLNETKKLKIRVIGLVRNKKKALLRFKNYLYRKDLKIIIQDIATPVKMREKIDFIIHAASHASPKLFEVDPVGTLKANTLGTYNLLQLAKKNSIKGFLYLSSGEVYGAPLIGKAVKETDYGYIDLARVRSSYAESKRIGEIMCVSWHYQFKVPAKIARLFHTYGPGVRLADGRVYADFISNIIRKQNIVMKSDGKDIRSFCYIADTVAGLLTLLFKGKSGEAYNLGNENAKSSIKNLADILTKLYPDKKLKVIRRKRDKNDTYADSKINTTYPDTDKLRQLGWTAKFGIKEGFKRTIDSFLNEVI